MRLSLNLPTVPAEKYGVAQAPEIGVDTLRVRFAPVVPVKIGVVNFTAHNAATFSATGAAIPANYHLVARVSEASLRGVAPTPLTPIVITLAASLEGIVNDNVVATFTNPGWSEHQINEYPEFATRDFIPATGGNVAKYPLSVSAIGTVSGGSAGGKVEVWAIPNAELFVEAGCVRSKNGGAPQPKTINIACGRNASAHTKKGRREIPNLELTFPYKGALEGLNRFAGTKGTVILDIDKDGESLTQIEIYSGFIPAAATPRGDGDEEVVSTIASPYEQFFFGYAL